MKKAAVIEKGHAHSDRIHFPFDSRKFQRHGQKKRIIGG